MLRPRARRMKKSLKPVGYSPAVVSSFSLVGDSSSSLGVAPLMLVLELDLEDESLEMMFFSFVCSMFFVSAIVWSSPEGGCERVIVATQSRICF